MFVLQLLQLLYQKADDFLWHELFILELVFLFLSHKHSIVDCLGITVRIITIDNCSHDEENRLSQHF